IAGGSEIEPFNRSGSKPAVVMTEGRDSLHRRIAETLERLAGEGFDSTAVICRTAAEAAQAYEALRERSAVRLVTKDTPQFEKGVTVIPAYLAKGVEFDAVLIYDASEQTYGH